MNATLESRPPRKVSEPGIAGPAARCLDVKQVAEALRSSRSEILRKVALKEFPAPFKFGRKNLWRETTIAALVERMEKATKRS